MRLPITLIFVLTTLTAFGQSRKGHVYLSGNTSLSAERVFADPEPLPVIGVFRPNANEDEDVTTWRARSSRIGYFLTHRLMVGTDLYVGTKTFDGRDESNYFLDPFVRYYVTNRPGRKVNFFAQLGFGTIGDYGFGSNYETNFHLGGGAEIRLSDDVAASALLRYNAQAAGLNFTELELQLNVFIGGGLGKSAGPTLVKGSIMIDPAIGSIQLGHRGRDETFNLIADLNLSGGYFLHDRWMVEAGFTLNSDQYRSNNDFDRLAAETGELQASALLGGRFFPTSVSRLRPYLLGRTHFSLNEQSLTPSFGGAAGREITNTQSALHLQAGVGSLFSLSDNVALDAEVLYAAPVAGEALREVRGRVGLKVFLPQ
jgi:opacity protein-like surface antigen